MRLIHKLTTIASCLLWAGLSTAESLPRTSSGKPDFEGNWDYGSLTPLERPEQFKDKSHFTPEEAQDFVANFGNYIEGVFEKLEGAEFVGLDTWLDWGAFVEPDLRTSRVVDPSNGKIPERTDSAKTRLKKFGSQRSTYSDPEVLMLTERCLPDQAPILRAPDNNYIRIVQTPDHVVILKEFEHTARVIPFNIESRLPSHIRFWTGDSRARWEGDTLVVVTTNFRKEYSLEGSGPNMQLTERFDIVGQNQLRYEFTVDDSESFHAPWTVLTYMRRTKSPVYEYACHEGNMSMRGILLGSRLIEKEQSTAPE